MNKIQKKELANFKVLKDFMDGKIKEAPTKWEKWQLRPEANFHMTLNSRTNFVGATAFCCGLEPCKAKALAGQQRRE